MSKPSNSNKLVRFFKAPARLLSRARDIYVDTITGCSDVKFDLAGGLPVPLPRSKSQGFNGSRTARDAMELNRAGPLRKTMSLNGRKAKWEDTAKITNLMAIHTIHEDRSCNFEDDDTIDEFVMYSRSKSCVVGGRKRMGVRV